MERDSYIDSFLKEHFDGNELKKPLFYNSRVAIRFEMGADVEEDEARAAQVKQRAVALYNALNQPEDDVLVVLFMDKWMDEPVDALEPEVAEAFNTYIDQNHMGPLSKKEQEYRYKEPDDSDDVMTIRYAVRVKSRYVKLADLMEVIANQTLGLEPTVDGDIYVLNTTNRTIFHLYDDRGLDIAAANRETLRPIYEQYNGWILDYDRDRIDATFN
ncbi:DUF3885 domain-containing protein [Paenibacillus massiliensis]|uniref:DUF3885 domain-containing protein n=1 Tax=Paenibacillus massiliensis TaxID=225917 RepID=UPI0004284F70|nr:DUF3885 domain-containing protein [Paenibacillus massiliensis]